MEKATVNGVELEYEVFGSGDPVLFISPVLADGFLPLIEQPELGEHYELIHYHKRGWVGSTKTEGPVSTEEHAADAVGLLDHLGAPRVHVVGHSSGAGAGLQMALDAPSRVQTLVMLEPSLLSLPNGQAFLQGAGPVLEAYEAGDHEEAFAAFMTVVSGLDWETCRALLDDRVPGMVDQSIKDADTFFGVELAGLAEWTFTAEHAATIEQPVLSVLGSVTQPLWVEVADFLRSTVGDIEEREIDGVGHLLHLQRPEPVAHAIADFLARHPITVT